MTAAHKKFILNKLIPFIMREQGRGFDMGIGGSIEVLKKITDDPDHLIATAAIGLNRKRGFRLLYNWDVDWPKPFERKWAKAKTPLAQAKVACELLREVVKTNGKCLDE